MKVTLWTSPLLRSRLKTALLGPGALGVSLASFIDGHDGIQSVSKLAFGDESRAIWESRLFDDLWQSSDRGDLSASDGVIQIPFRLLPQGRRTTSISQGCAYEG